MAELQVDTDRQTELPDIESEVLARLADYDASNEPGYDFTEDVERILAATRHKASQQIVSSVENIKNSADLEQALISQLALAHRMVFGILNTAEHDNIGASVAVGPLLSQVTRLMRIFQQGVETLAKVQRKGTQNINVQYIHLSDDSKAVVTGPGETNVDNLRKE